jgi:putative molybdopterin biosynthesis protein
MAASIHNQLHQIRTSRGLTAASLATAVGVSRQTIHAIEAGSYVPNTEVALRLAHVLEVSVEELFSLQAQASVPSLPLSSDLLSATPVPQGQSVRMCRVGNRRVSIPVNASPYYLPEADAVVSTPARPLGKAELIAFEKEATHPKALVLAGCDPAIGLVSRMAEKLGAAEVISAPASSKLALAWLKEGKVHIAGSHLKDPASGDFNLPYLRSEFPNEDFAVISFARWEQGFLVAPGNPKNIKQASHLSRRNVRFVNREAGSGSRALLDQLLTDESIPPARISGYDRVAYGHLAVAYLVSSGEADCCLATRSAAQAFQLDFIPLQSERYDFVLRRQTLSLPIAQTFFDLLQRATLRRKLEVLAGYDTSQTGAVLA